MPHLILLSEFNQQEVVNAVDQAHREISNRYDFRDTGTIISFSENKITLSIHDKNGMMVNSKIINIHQER